MLKRLLSSSMRVAALLVLALFVAGCAASPASYLRKSHKAYVAKDYELVLKNMQVVVDAAPEVLRKKKNRDIIEEYRTSQIMYGESKAQEALNSDKISEAWAWYAQMALIDPTLEACKQADANAKVQREKLADQYLQKAKSYDPNVSREWIAPAAKSLMLQDSEEARQMLSSRGIQVNKDHVIDPVSNTDVAGTLRTDMLKRLREDLSTTPFCPYITPIYFGDVPHYYEVIKRIHAGGYPVTERMNPQFAKKQGDSLRKLSKKAQNLGADAIINVSFEAGYFGVTTYGDAVRFVTLPSSGAGSGK